jgi:excisionase family DNA binding protein
MAKRASYRLVKTHRSYTVDEVARLLSVCKGTVRRWIKNGLPVMQDKKPIMIRGADLKQFLKSQSKPKQECALDECRCFKCKGIRKVAFGEAEIIFDQSPAPNMHGLCSVCAEDIYKRISKAKIPAIQAILQITFKQADAPINDRTQPRLNKHL